jgi:hypothetical protein
LILDFLLPRSIPASVPGFTERWQASGGTRCAHPPYLEPAGREGVPLATLDTDLIRAARAENLTLLGD